MNKSAFRLREWQFYWRRWHLGWGRPYPDDSIKGMTHRLAFIGPLQLWFSRWERP